MARPSPKEMKEHTRNMFWEAVEEAALQGFNLNDIYAEVDECWLEFWRNHMSEKEAEVTSTRKERV